MSRPIRSSKYLVKIGAEYRRICSKCKGDPLPLDKFPRGVGALGTYSICRDCCSKRTRRSDHTKDDHLRKSYGISLEQFVELKAKQRGLCAICSSELRGGNGGEAVDHDHNTGGVRGILCSSCNLGLGHFRDDTELLIKASIYLNKNV